MPKRVIRPAKRDNLICLENAINRVRDARGWARSADCPRATEAIRRALKSLDGAKRHMHHRLARS